MINDVPNIPLRFSKQLYMAALECGISCPLGAPTGPSSQFQSLPLPASMLCSHFPSLLPKSHQRGRRGFVLCPILHLRLRKLRPQTPPLSSNSHPSCEGHGLAATECLVLLVSSYGKMGRSLDSGQSFLVQSVKVNMCCLLRYLTDCKCPESFAIISGSSSKNTLCRVATKYVTSL